MIVETRKKVKNTKLDFISSMLNPSASFGGLYTFSNIRKFSPQELDKLYSLDYFEMTKEIFLSLDINIPSEILESALKTYANFNSKDITPLVKIKENLYSLELYHGPTSAFKDMALQPFTKILDEIAKNKNEKYLILSATSGDTGPATLEGFKEAANILALCIYPASGTSEVQKRQMTTMDAKNIKVCAIKGNFDDAQSELKSLINNDDFIQKVKSLGYKVSVANSINIARIAFQIVYYFEISKKMKNTIFDVIVPSGNFGNALGAFFAKNMGVKIDKIKIATNPNDMLDIFFRTGAYDLRQKVLIPSYSPAMDILKSSNIERMLYFYLGETRTRDLMESLDRDKYFHITNDELEKLQNTFLSNSFSDNECLEGIRECFLKHKYVIDPHTSNAYLFAKKYLDSILDSNNLKPQVIISTASFVKFIPTMLRAFNLGNTENEKEGLKILQDFFMKNSIKGGNHINKNILELFSKAQQHCGIYDKKDIENEILKWISNY